MTFDEKILFMDQLKYRQANEVTTQDSEMIESGFVERVAEGFLVVTDEGRQAYGRAMRRHLN